MTRIHTFENRYTCQTEGNMDTSDTHVWLCFTGLTTTIPHSFTRDFIYDRYQSRFFIFISVMEVSTFILLERIESDYFRSAIHESSLKQSQPTSMYSSLVVCLYVFKWQFFLQSIICSRKTTNLILANEWKCKCNAMQLSFSLCGSYSVIGTPFHFTIGSSPTFSLISFEHKSSLRRHNWNVMRRLTDYR